MKILFRLITLAAILGCAAPAAQAFHEFNYKFDVSLSGSNNVAGGDPDGSGMAEIIVDAFAGVVWWDISVADIAAVTIDHIHMGAAGTIGPPVINFDGTLMGSASIDVALAQNIVNNSAEYYVNVHTADFPGGAVRGQLGQATLIAKPVPDSMSTATGMLACLGLLIATRLKRKKRA